MQALPIETAAQAEPPVAARLTTAEFVTQCRDTMIPLAGSLAYFSIIPIDEKETERLILDPTSAFPPRLTEIIPNLRLVLVPYLESGVSDDEANSRHAIVFRPPPDEKRCLAAFTGSNGDNYLFLAIRDEGLFDAHVLLYRNLADKIITLAGEEFSEPFYAMVNSELSKHVRGEVFENAWQLKKEVLCYQGDSKGRAKILARYQRQALEDTLTLYLHGLCCDIDVDAGPKQLPSKLIRARLMLLRSQLPPPKGIALFPEELPGA